MLSFIEVILPGPLQDIRERIFGYKTINSISLFVDDSDGKDVWCSFYKGSWFISVPRIISGRRV